MIMKNNHIDITTSKNTYYYLKAKDKNIHSLYSVQEDYRLMNMNRQ